jgi:hypothetical protein
VQVSNRQNVNEEISLRLIGYPQGKFLDLSGGSLSADKRTLNITLLPAETKTATILVYTGDICTGCQLNITGTSLIHSGINGTERVRITVVFPAEFSGLSWTGLAILMCLAGMIYLRYGNKK